MTKKKKHSNLNSVQPPLTRRRFLRRVSALTVASTALAVGGYAIHGDDPVRRKIERVYSLKDFRVPPSALFPSMAVVHGTRVDAMVQEAVSRLGGIGRFIQKGDRVLLKPNVGWDRQPEQAANTGPEVVAAVVRLCREAGAKSILVTDVSLNDPQRSFARSGIEAAVVNAGGVVRLPGVEDFLLTDLQGALLKTWLVSRFFQEADKVINLPIVKHHSLCGCTLAMKNWYGIIGGRRNQLHQDIHTSIVDLAAAARPTLTIIDATRVLKRNGPTGGNLDDVGREDTIIASLDEVALDSFSLGYLGLTPDQVPFLALAEKRGLGRVDWRSLNKAEVQVG